VRGPFLLRPLQVDIAVPTNVGGVFCLGKNPKHVSTISRAERNMRDAIKGYWKEYEFFWFEPTLSTKECFVAQCRHYHKHMNNGGLDNAEHPKSSDNGNHKCPICGD